MENKKCWMIRDKATGLYSSGGSVPHFKKRGKVFFRRSDLDRHLAMWAKYCMRPGNTKYNNAEIVEFDVIECSKKNIGEELAIYRI